MRSRLDRKLVVVSVVSALAATAGGCIDEFSGSNLEIDFAAKTAEPGPYLPPSNTYYTLYAVDQVRDADGNVLQATLFAVQQFRIVPVVDLDSPCAIETVDPYPGLHISQFANKEREQTGVTDPFQEGQDEVLVQRVVTADERVRRAALYEEIKAVTSSSFLTYPALAPACVEDQPGVDPALIPPADCIGEQSNARRLALCQAAWATDPSRYEGTDRSLTAPIAGTLYGFVQGANPVNGAPLGGVNMFVDEVLAADAYTINWQFADLDGNGQPDYPVDFPESERSPTGVGYLSGVPGQITRGVIDVPMRNIADPAIAAHMSIFSDLADDPVSF
jgi:hypothetical protein